MEPFVGPYYDTYASPYVEKAKPYVDTANTRLIRPATVLAVDKYQAYAAPQLARVQGYAQSQWEKRGLPQLQKAQETVQQVYDENLAASVQKASEAAAPLYESARDNALHAHEKHIIPAIAYSQPHLQKGYYAAQKLILETGIPFVHHAWTNLVIFFDGTLWPFVKKIYNDNVQPQLVMIGERIAKYQEGRKLKSAIDNLDASSTTIATTSLSASTQSTTISTEPSSSTSSTTPASATNYATTSQPPQVATDETITADLAKWQKKFAVAADTGGDDLKERIEELVSSMLKSGLGEGKGLATALEKTAEVELDAVKAKIKSVVSLLTADAKESDTAAAEAEVGQFVRKSANNVKERAKAVRLWSHTFQRALDHRAELASDSTVQILNGIRDLGLQEIGMRWAWMEGVTYKHWQKYHDLKKKFAAWTSEVTENARSNPALTDAKDQAEKLLGESMVFTEETAKELARLRDVAKWKISARDATDDFDTRSIPVVAAAASAATALSDSASSIILGETGRLESLASDASNTASSGLSGVSAAAQDAVSSASSAVVGSSTGSVESFTSSVLDGASSALNSATSSASLLASSATAPPSEGILSSASSIADSISSSAASAVADAEVSSKFNKAVNDAGDRVADATSSWSSGS